MAGQSLGHHAAGDGLSRSVLQPCPAAIIVPVDLMGRSRQLRPYGLANGQPLLPVRLDGLTDRVAL
jgi:hypothetical protein